MSRLLIPALLGLVTSLLTGGVQASSDLNVVVILDNSGSMNEQMLGGNSRIQAAKKSLLRVLEQTPTDAQIGVLLLNPGPSGRWLAPLGPVDAGATREAVQTLRADGRTPLGSTMKMAADALLDLRERQRYGVYKLLIVSDGEATDGDLVNRFLPEIQSRGLLIDVIGVAMPNQHSLATRASTYRTADDSASLEKAISAVVLGESSPDDENDAGQSDFELLEPLPGKLATALLTALTTARNEPIGTAPAASRTEPARAPPAPQDASQWPQPPVRDAPEGGIPFFTIFVAGFIIVLCLRMFSAIGKS